jgi:hypothetical protein
MRTYWGVEVLLHALFDRGTIWRCVVSFTSRPLYPKGKSPRHPLDRRLGGPQSQSGHGVEKKNSQSPPRESNPDLLNVKFRTNFMEYFNKGPSCKTLEHNKIQFLLKFTTFLGTFFQFGERIMKEG